MQATLAQNTARGTGGKGGGGGGGGGRGGSGRGGGGGGGSGGGGGGVTVVREIEDAVQHAVARSQLPLALHLV